MHPRVRGVKRVCDQGGIHSSRCGTARAGASRLGRRSETSRDEETGEGGIVFQDGTGTLTATEGALLLAVETDADHLDLLEDVLGRHLVRFGTKDELVVEWRRDTGEPGTTQRKAEEG